MRLRLKWMPLTTSLTLMLFGGICEAQTSQTQPTVSGNPVALPPGAFGTEYIVTIDGREMRAITASHAKAIEAGEAQAAGDAKLIPVLQAHIKDLQAQVDALKANEQTLKDVAGLRQQVIDLKDGQMKVLQAVETAQLRQISSDAKIDALGKKAWYEKGPVKFTFTLLGGAANIRDLTRPNPQAFPMGAIVQLPPGPCLPR